MRLIDFTLVKRCPTCGHLFPQEMTDCPYCKGEVNVGIKQNYTDTNPLPTESFNREINWKKIAIIAASLLMAAIIALVVVILLKNNDNSKVSKEEFVTEKQDVKELSEDSSKTENIVKESAFDTPSAESYDFDGNITYKSDIYYFQMHLDKRGNKITGQYMVTNGEGVWVSLNGTVDNNGKAVVREYKNGSATGYYFEGYLNRNSFSGKYKTNRRKLVMNFNASSY